MDLEKKLALYRDMQVELALPLEQMKKLEKEIKDYVRETGETAEIERLRGCAGNLPETGQAANGENGKPFDKDNGGLTWLSLRKVLGRSYDGKLETKTLRTEKLWGASLVITR
jgi:hypothetical protein